MNTKQKTRRIAITITLSAVCLIIGSVLLMQLVEIHNREEAREQTASIIVLTNDYDPTIEVPMATAKSWTPTREAKLATEPTP